MTTAACLLLPALLAWAAIALLRRSRLAELAADRPNERSLHAIPTPRVGGLGLMAVALPAAAWGAAEPFGAALGCAAALVLISFLDDLRSLPIEVRLPAHLVAALLVVLATPPAAGLSAVMLVLVVVGISWMANLFNFMDGADGLAGLMAAIGFFALSLAAWFAGDAPLACACAAIASASVGFLAHNFPPARVFLGDAGSVPLGFLAGALAWIGAVRELWPLWLPALVFSPFIVDATVTVLRRLARGERIWTAHRTHYYQRLVLHGWTHRRLAVHAGALMVAVAASALVAFQCVDTARWSIIFGWGVAYLLLTLVLERRLSSA